MKYYFGRATEFTVDGYCIIEADSLDFAIYKFAYSQADKFEEYVDGKSCKYAEYDYVLNRYFIDSEHRDNAKIEIYIKENDNYKFIKKVSIKELESFNFKEVEKSLSKDKTSNTDTTLPMKQDKSLEICSDNLPEEFKQGKVNTVAEYNEVERRLQQRMAELEKMKNDIKLQVKEMEKWLKSKYRVICAFETYLGTNEEIVELIGEGNTSDKPIHFYQLMYYMDEEYGIKGLENLENTNFIEEKQFDYKDIHFFDEWIKLHFKEYIPEERGIRLWRIVRYDKQYGDRYENMVENQKNRTCYFLIRNGDRLYRIFSDISGHEGTMFPTESQSMQAGHKWGSKEFNQEDFDNSMLPWKYILVALQGLIDRTDILGTDCKMKYNLITGQFDPSKIILVRDAEYTNLISDKTMPSWNEYFRNNRKNIKKGHRIIITDMYKGESRNNDSDFIWYHNMDWRRKYCDKPSTNMVYEIKDVKDNKYKILYFESDLWWGEEPRKKRTACWMSDDEIFDLDNCTKEDLMYYLKDRRNKSSYLQYIPTIQLAYKYLNAKAFEREDYYKKFEDN